MSRHFATLNREPDPPADLRSVSPHNAPANGNAQRRDRSAIAEDEIIKLVHRVFILPGTAKAPRVVALCGVDKGAGCSWVCARTERGAGRANVGHGLRGGCESPVAFA